MSKGFLGMSGKIQTQSGVKHWKTQTQVDNFTIHTKSEGGVTSMGEVTSQRGVTSMGVTSRLVKGG